MKKALITGINGQDGSYLAELLLSQGYSVHGIVRREALEDAEHRLINIRHLLDKIHLHSGSIDNQLSVYRVIANVLPDECYHLAASSFVSYSFDDEASVISSNFNATHYILSSLKELVPQCRVYFAGSSEMFGDVKVSPQSEETPFNPRSVYGISKLAAFHLVRNYRINHGMHISTGILYNHESPRRGHQFVTRKISSTVAKIHLGLADYLEIGNIESLRDWGYAPEYVAVMQRMLKQKQGDDFVISTGVLHSVRDFLEAAFLAVNLDYRDYIRVNRVYFRPKEAVPLMGNSTKACELLGWAPQKGFQEIVEEMVLSDINLIKSKG